MAQELEMIPVRATVTIGSLAIQTPYVLSFNVNRTRGQISTCSASIKVDNSEAANTMVGGRITITAGRKDAEKDVFSGIVRSANVTPCRDDPMYVILSVSGNDILSELQGKKYTRRCRSTQAVWVGIEGIARPGLKSGKFAFVPGESHFETNTIVENAANNYTTNLAATSEPTNIPNAPDKGLEKNPTAEITPADPA